MKGAKWPIAPLECTEQFRYCSSSRAQQIQLGFQQTPFEVVPLLDVLPGVGFPPVTKPHYRCTQESIVSLRRFEAFEIRMDRLDVLSDLHTS